MISKTLRMVLILGMVTLFAGSAWALPQDCDDVCTGYNPSRLCTMPGSTFVTTCIQWEQCLFAPVETEVWAWDPAPWLWQGDSAEDASPQPLMLREEQVVAE